MLLLLRLLLNTITPRHCEGQSPEAISTDNLCLIQRLLRYTRNDAFGLLSC